MSSALKNYNDTINYLYNLRKHGIKLGLSNIKCLMSILGEPHRSFNSVHIAGTNGKGSTASIIASILIESGFKVGLYTSPHLASFTERIRINNEHITELEVIRLTEEIKSQIANSKSQILNPTFFEFVTAMAFYYFSLKKVEWAVVETGMGGRFDATNVINPHISIITSIGLDHVEFLGETISKIAFEKAGIIKPGVPVITTSTHPDAIEQITEVASGSGSDIHIYDSDFKGSLLSINSSGIWFDYYGYKDYKDLFLPLTGRYQLHNASLAIRACEILKKKGVSMSDVCIIRGLENVKLEGRFETISRHPFIILDGAHNPEAVNKLCETVKEIFPEKRLIIVIGILKDKDVEGILKPLSQIAETIILTRPKGERASSPEELNEYLKGLQQTSIKSRTVHTRTILTGNVAEALNTAKREWDENSIILVTGSFYTTGEVKELMGHDAVLSELRE